MSSPSQPYQPMEKQRQRPPTSPKEGGMMNEYNVSVVENNSDESRISFGGSSYLVTAESEGEAKEIIDELLGPNVTVQAIRFLRATNQPT